MRILVLNQYFHPDQSATSQLLSELCEDLAAHHHVEVVTGRPSYNPVEASSSRGIISRERYGDVAVRRVWSTSFDRSSMVRRLTNYATYLLSSVAGALSMRRPDVVVALTDPPPVGLIAAGVARVRRVPFVLVVKDVFPEIALALGTFDQPLVSWSLKRVSRTIYRSATAIVSIGDDMTARLTESGVPLRKISTIHDWADGDALRPGDGTAFRRSMGWEDRFVVMHSGNVGLSQGLESLLETADRLRHVERIIFAVIGEGASKASLMAQAQHRGLSNVHFLPYQRKDALAESLGAADLHLVSLREGLAGYIVPSKVYGIMAVGKPFVAAVERRAEPAAIVEAHGCGVSVPPSDPGALAKAIETLSEQDLTKMGARSRQAFELLYERRISTEAYRKLLEGLLPSGVPDRV